MAVKTITIDMEAYTILSRRKRSGQSFSQTIKEHFGRIRTGRDLERALQRIHVSDDLIEALEEQVRSRRKSPATAAEL